MKWSNLKTRRRLPGRLVFAVGGALSLVAAAALAGVAGPASASVARPDLSSVVLVNSVTCVKSDRAVCFAVGGSGSDGGEAFFSDDFFATSTQLTLPSGVPGLSSVSCPSTTRCVAANSLEQPYVIVTTDQGSTWTKEPTPSLADAVSCISGTKTCFAVGYGSQSGVPDEVMKTTDLGSSWTQQPLPVAVDNLYAIDCPSVKTCYAAGDDNKGAVVVQTVNGGTTWAGEDISDSSFAVLGISCPSATTCYAAGIMGSPNVSGMWKTSNSGGTWAGQTIPAGGRELFGDYCPTTTTCYADGGPSSGSQATMYKTINGGTRWKSQTIPPALFGQGRTVYCARPWHCLAAGVGPAIAGTSNGGRTWGLS